MAISGLGSISDIWRWPFHYYLAVRREYLNILNTDRGGGPANEEETTEIAPGVFRTEIKRVDEGRT